MPTHKPTIGILTSGGDCPGLNAVIRAAVKSSEQLGYDCIGFLRGYEGLVEPVSYMPLNSRNTAGILTQGGTILGATNKGRFSATVGEDQRVDIDPTLLEQVATTVRQLSICGLICVGGDGSLTIAQQLHEYGIPVIGVPKTIDNDLGATAFTFGFDSAVACATDALDRLHTTAASHERIMVLEVMGRHAGWIALYGGLSGGADIILIPEIPFDFEKIAAEVNRREKEGAKSTMIVVAEGASPKQGRPLRHSTASGEHRLGGIGDLVGREVAARTEKEVRTCILGHLQRGGAPTALDRILGTRFGVKAVQLIQDGKFGTMVSYQNYQTLDVPISHAVHRLRRVDPGGQMVQTARAVEISFGD